MRLRNLIWLSAVAAVLTTGCSPDATAPRAVPAVQTSNSAPTFWETGASLYWNGVARDLVVEYKSSPFAAVRGLALLSNAQYQSVAAALGTTGKTRPSTTAAVARASAVALTYLYPAEASALDALVTEELLSPDWPGDKGGDIASGDAIGRAIAQQLVSDATTDRFFASWTGTVPTGTGIWFSSSTPPAPPVGAMFGLARTYYLTSGDQFRPPPPPAFDSPEYLDALHEVRQISDTRTAEQLANALYWALPGGTVTPPGFWNVEAANLVEQYRLSELATSRVFAVINKTGFDAIVACHDAKFFYWLIRPTQADPNINLAVALPNFPSYPSDHACVSGAMTAVLGSFFPAEKTRLDALAEQAALSRLEGGLHYRFDNETGLRLGREVAGLALSIEGPGRH